METDFDGRISWIQQQLDCAESKQEWKPKGIFNIYTVTTELWILLLEYLEVVR